MIRRIGEVEARLGPEVIELAELRPAFRGQLLHEQRVAAGVDESAVVPQHVNHIVVAGDEKGVPPLRPIDGVALAQLVVERVRVGDKLQRGELVLDRRVDCHDPGLP